MLLPLAFAIVHHDISTTSYKLLYDTVCNKRYQAVIVTLRDMCNNGIIYPMTRGHLCLCPNPFQIAMELWLDKHNPIEEFLDHSICTLFI